VHFLLLPGTHEFVKVCVFRWGVYDNNQGMWRGVLRGGSAVGRGRAVMPRRSGGGSDAWNTESDHIEKVKDAIYNRLKEVILIMY
jgi:hypothetical protein